MGAPQSTWAVHSNKTIAPAALTQLLLSPPKPSTAEVGEREYVVHRNRLATPTTSAHTGVGIAGTTLTPTSGSPWEINEWKGGTITMTSGALSGESRAIIANSSGEILSAAFSGARGATDAFTVSRDYDTIYRVHARVPVVTSFSIVGNLGANPLTLQARYSYAAGTMVKEFGGITPSGVTLADSIAVSDVELELPGPVHSLANDPHRGISTSIYLVSNANLNTWVGLEVSVYGFWRAADEVRNFDNNDSAGLN